MHYPLDPKTLPPWEHPEFMPLIRRVLLQNAIALTLLYTVKQLRPLRRWYWRLAALVLALALGYAEYDERRNG